VSVSDSKSIKGNRTCVDAFAGSGGLSLGLIQAGFAVVAAFDADEKATETYNRNIPRFNPLKIEPLCLHRKIEDITTVDLLSGGELEAGELDLIAGGPPCQGFSRQKRGAHRGDERNGLVLRFARLIADLKPACFLLENVDMLGQVRGAKFRREFEDILSNYQTVPHFYNSADYGLAQTRVRFVVVGTRTGLPGKYTVPEPTTPRWLTVKDRIGDLPEPPLDYTVHPDYPNHQRARVTAINIERFSHVRPGHGWEDIPYDLRLECHKKVDTSKGGWPDVYGRLEWGGQCPTITGGFDSFTRGRYGHPSSDRPLTPREAARLQGFPDEFVFCGNRGDVRSQIGNAVPVPLARAIGGKILEILKASSPS
jgi:DNA (cytosine-5)-methyltransferase 1